LLKKMRFIYILIFVLFVFNYSYAETQFYKCPEKINKVRTGDSFLHKEGANIGTNFIKLDNSIISIHFLFKDSKEKPFELITNEVINKTALGFEVKYKSDTNKSNTEIYYNFIDVGKTLAYTKTDFWWHTKDKDAKEQKHDYDSSGRCIKISNSEYKTYLKLVINTDKKNKKTKKIEKKQKKTTKKNEFKGERVFALSWEGIEELIIGTLSYDEKNLIGKIDFELPNGKGNCFGTYVLSTIKGTWSMLCEKANMNASGILKWNNNNGSVTGEGKDQKGKKVKFKVSGAK